MTTSRLTLATIVATIGPASQGPDVIRRLILAGVNVFRFNFSHGTPEEHAARLKAVREASRDLDRPVAVLGDLPGPKIRITKVAEPGITINPGQDVLLDPTLAEAHPATEGTSEVTRFGCTVPGIAQTVLAGHKVLINDGALRLLCVDKLPGDPAEEIRCRVIVGGLVTSGKGVNFPSSQIKVGALTDRDRAWARWAGENQVDYLALSFVRSAEEVLELKTLVANAPGGPIPIVSKIEKPQAVEAIESIVQASDAIMVARGDLGVETDVALVPIIQKRLIQVAGKYGKPCIVATQMLESMITSSTPTRAEASDVANAILDGADAVMLSGETAVGKHPVLVVETMKRIIAAAEGALAEGAGAPSPSTHDLASGHRTAALALATWHAAKGVEGRAVVVWSQRGGAARHLSQIGFNIPILAYSSDVQVTRRMQLLRGVTALCAPPPASLSSWNAMIDEDLLVLQIARIDEPVILVAGLPLGTPGTPNTIAFHKVGDPRSGFQPGA